MAARPAPSARPREGDILHVGNDQSSFAGESVIGVVVMLSRSRGPGLVAVGLGGWVRSKPVRVEWSQKLDALRTYGKIEFLNVT